MKSAAWALWKECGAGHYTSFRRRLFPAMYLAHKAVALAIKRGDLKPPSDFSCIDCGAKAEHYDHRDYRQQLLVDPVCRTCNYRRGPAPPYLDRSLETLRHQLKRRKRSPNGNQAARPA